MSLAPPRARAATTAPLGAPRGRDHLPGLDGLRALAVIAVIVFHLHAPWLPGGFLGVDVFFVISGFLITTLLIREHRRTGRLDLPRFWVRRARRLLPALAVVVVLTTLAARFVEGDLLVGIARQSIGALTFSTNWLEIGAGTDYFHATTPQLFMNFWSLAVEEQFYLVWPLATLLLLRFAPRGTHRIAVPLAIGLGSALLMALLLDPAAATRVYYGTDTHLIGLMLGAALAHAYAAPHRAWTRTAAWARLHLPLTGWALVILATLLVTSDEGSAWTFRLGIPLASLATALLILSVVSTPSPFRTGSQARPLTWIGDRSYGIYLWHWPVILVVGALWPVAPGGTSFLASRALALALTLALAAASHRFVESPVRRLGFRESTVRLREHLETLTPRSLRLVTATALVVTITYAAALGTAPARTSTEALLAANARAAAGPAGAPAQAPVVVPASAIAETDSPAAVASPAEATPQAEAAPPAEEAPSAELPPPPGTEEPEATFTMPTGAQIDAYGDSMLVGSLHALHYYFEGIRLDGRSNRRWSDGLAAVRARGADNRRAVVLAFGTNAGTDRAAVEQVLDLLGPRRMVVLVTEHGPFSRIEQDNAVLAEVAAARDNVVLADWHAALAGTSGQLQSDGIHPSRVGSHLFARTIRAALAELSARHTGVVPVLPDLPIP